MANEIPQVLKNYEAYLEGNRLLGIVDVTMPSVQAETVEMKGPGTIGTTDVPIKGSLGSMTSTLNFRTVTENVADLLEQDALHIELWGAIQSVDTGTGAYKVPQHKVIMRGTFKQDTLGTMTVGDVQGRNLEYEVTYLREFFKGKEIREIDKFNNIYKVNGKDMLKDTNKAVGL